MKKIIKLISFFCLLIGFFLTPGSNINSEGFGTFLVSDYGSGSSSGNYFYRGYLFEVSTETEITHLIGGGTDGNFIVGLYTATHDGDGARPIVGDKINADTLLGFVTFTSGGEEQILALNDSVTLQPDTLYVLAQGRSSGTGSHYYVNNLDVQDMIDSSPRIAYWFPQNNRSLRWNGTGNENFVVNETQHLDEDGAMPTLGFRYASAVLAPSVTTSPFIFDDGNLVLPGNLASTGGGITTVGIEIGQQANLSDSTLYPINTEVEEDDFTFSLDDFNFNSGTTYYYRAYAINENTRVNGDTLSFALFGLNYTAGAGGSIEGQTSQAVLINEDGTQVEAIPNEGYDFIDWSDGVETPIRQDLNITSGINVTANFQIRTYAVNYIASEGGTILGNSEQVIDHGSDALEVEAIPDDRYRFVRWSDNSTENPRQDLNITEAMDISAIFRRSGGRNVAPVIEIVDIWFENAESSMSWPENDQLTLNYQTSGSAPYINKLWSPNGEDWQEIQRHSLNNGNIKLDLSSNQGLQTIWVKVQVTDLANIVSEVTHQIDFLLDEIEEVEPPQNEEEKQEIDSEDMDSDDMDSDDTNQAELAKESFLESLPPSRLAPSPYNSQIERVDEVQPNTFIRGENYDIVYYVNSDYIRRPFINEQVLATYISSWSEVQIVSDATLPFMRVGEPMLPKPGLNFIKLQSIKDVYITDFEGNPEEKHHIPDEAL